MPIFIIVIYIGLLLLSGIFNALADRFFDHLCFIADSLNPPESRKVPAETPRMPRPPCTNASRAALLPHGGLIRSPFHTPPTPARPPGRAVHGSRAKPLSAFYGAGHYAAYNVSLAK